MTTLLAIDTSADACSLALWRDGLLAERHEMLPRSHTQHILPMVDSLLTKAELTLGQLDAIAFGRGPGSFTGLRVCASVVQGLAFAASLPCVPVSSLAALALTAAHRHALPEGTDILSCVDARMDEVYHARYRLVNRLPECITEEQLSAPEQLTAEGEFFRVGSGWQYGERIPAFSGNPDTGLLPRAASVAELGAHLFRENGGVDVEAALPRYLRDQVAWR